MFCCVRRSIFEYRGGGYDLDGRAVRSNDTDLLVGEIVRSRKVLASIIQEIYTKASENSEI